VKPFLAPARARWHGLKRRQLKKNLFSRETHAFFFFMPPTRARLPGLEKIGENWLE